MSLAARSEFDRLPPAHRQVLPSCDRATPQQLAREVRLASESPIVRALLKAADSVLLVLNAQRQIVAASNVTGAVVPDVIGRRPGEAFGCVNAQGPRGCGSSPACETCGALGAILASRHTGRPTEAECLMRSVVDGDGASFEFNVRSTPVEIGGVELTAVGLRDISGEKRREALEQIFFHDVLNTVGGLRGWSSQLLASGTDGRHAAERIEFLSRRLEREICDHRDLVRAESGTLVPVPARVVCSEVLGDVELLLAPHPVARQRRLELRADPPDLALVTDPSLLMRVLVNMVRNALEATAPGGTVSVRAAHDRGDRVRFSVHNAAAMEPDVQFHVFQRSFSTKGERGRGLGTYSMKLLGERYLRGEVSFESSADRGTTFWISLPVNRRSPG